MVNQGIRPLELAKEWAKMTPIELLHLYGALTRAAASCGERHRRMDLSFETRDHLRAIEMESMMESFYVMDALMLTLRGDDTAMRWYYSVQAMQEPVTRQ